MSKIKYTLIERLDIGRQVYYNDITAQEAADKYDISPFTAMNYARMFRDDNNLPRKPMHNKKKAPVASKIKDTPPRNFSLKDYQAMSKEELINELVAARVAEARLKKGYMVKGVGPEKEFIPLDSKNTK